MRGAFRGGVSVERTAASDCSFNCANAALNVEGQSNPVAWSLILALGLTVTC